MRRTAFLRPVAMIALLGGLWGALGVAAATAIGSARPAPDMRAVLGSPPCAAPCWRHITPGVTPLFQAVAAIQDDPALEDLIVNVQSATWWWNGAQPAGLSHKPRPFDGRMLFRIDSPDSTVDGLALMTSLPLADFIGALGAPDRHILYFPPVANRPGGLYAAEYGEITVFAALHCPVGPGDFWTTEAGVAFGQITLDLGGPVLSAQTGPGWPVAQFLDYCRG